VPKINVYLPAWLAEAVKESGVPVSSVCQQALEAALSAGHPGRAGGTVAPGRSRDVERVLTNRARQVLRDARRPDVSAGLSAGLRLLDALEREGGNLALVVLRSLGLERHEPSPWSAAADPATAGDAVGHDLDWLVEQAATEAADLGDRYVGCEHLLLAVVADGDGPAARALVRAGAAPATVRQATRTAAAAAAFARTRSASTVVNEAVTTALAEIRLRLGRLEQR